MTLRSVRLSLTSCPECKTQVDAAGVMEGHLGPKPEDLTVCVYCLAVSKYDQAMQLRAFDVATLSETDLAQIEKVRTHLRTRVSN